EKVKHLFEGELKLDQVNIIPVLSCFELDKTKEIIVVPDTMLDVVAEEFPQVNKIKMINRQPTPCSLEFSKNGHHRQLCQHNITLTPKFLNYFEIDKSITETIKEWNEKNSSYPW